MKSGMALTLMLAQTPVAAPSPQASPLKQIIDVKSRALCTTLGSKIQIALVGLMKNDQVIEAGKRTFEKMAWDQAQGSKALEMDRLQLKNAVAAMVHNLYSIDQVLDDPSRFPPNPATDDERVADRMKAALQAVEERQKVQLNILNGTVETEALSAMRHEFADFSPTTTNASQGSVAAASPPAITDAGLQQPKPAATAVPLTFARSGSNEGVAATSPNAAFATAMADVQASGAASESRAAAIIVPVARECGSAGDK